MLVRNELTLKVAHDRIAKMTPNRVLKAKIAQTQGFRVSGCAAMAFPCRTTIYLDKVCRAFVQAESRFKIPLLSMVDQRLRPSSYGAFSAFMFSDNGASSRHVIT